MDEDLLACRADWASRKSGHSIISIMERGAGNGTRISCPHEPGRGHRQGSGRGGIEHCLKAVDSTGVKPSTQLQAILDASCV